MNTAEMWVVAQKTERMYECVDGDILYSKKTGLVDKNNLTPWNLKAWEQEGAGGLDELMKCQWAEKEIRYMTAKEIEKEFGVRVIR